MIFQPSLDKKMNPTGLLMTSLERRIFHMDVKVLEEINRGVTSLDFAKRMKTNPDTPSIQMPLAGSIFKHFGKGSEVNN